MSQVTVICPGARRHNIKVTPNTVLLQVLEQACAKQKLDPALYCLKHHSKLLDLSLTLRYSGVPNNGKLELIPADKPRSEGGDVVVAVQTADGARVQSTFHSSTSLWDVLMHHGFDSNPDGMEPSLTYMRQEVSGESALKSKTLRAIGLSTGRGILRLGHRSVLGRSVALSDVRAGEDMSLVRKSTSSSAETVTTVLPGGERGRGQGEGSHVGGERWREGEGSATGKEGNRQEDMIIEEGGVGKGGGEGEREMEDDAEPRKKPGHAGVVSMDTGGEGEQLPYFPAHPFSYFSNSHDEGETETSSRGPPEPTTVPHPVTQPSAAVSLARETLQQLNHSHQFPPEVITAQLEEVTSSPFAQFAGLPRPHPLTTPISLQPKVYDEPCERQMVVYHLDTAPSATPTEDVSDTFFEHTVADIQLMRSDLQRQTKSSDAPLMTRAMRTVRDEMKLEKYKKSVVRVYFPDRWVLQGCFKPRESLKNLVTFIREHLANPLVKFHLYTTPPKKVLKNAKTTFAEAGFLPTAVVYVGVADGKPHPQLSDSALQHTSAALQAEIVCRSQT